MILYGSSFSPFVRKVLVALAEKGVEAEHRPVRPHDPDPVFAAASPFGKIPAIDDGGLLLADSSAILAHLERTRPVPPLYPTDTVAHGRAVWFDEVADTEMVPRMSVIFRERFLKPKILGQPGDEAVAQKAITETLPKVYDYLEGQIDGPYLVGGAFGVADIAIASPFHNLRLAEVEVDRTRWPRLAGYVEATLARPSFVKAVAARTH